MSETLDAALESLRRQQFFEAMAAAEAQLRSDPVAWEAYVQERDTWINPDLASS